LLGVKVIFGASFPIVWCIRDSGGAIVISILEIEKINVSESS
jgi:hypothetical protein